MSRSSVIVSLMCALSLVGLVLGAEVDLGLVEAVKKGDKDAVRSLIAAQTDVNAPGLDGATALHWAAYRNDLDTAELLIAAGADLDASNDYGATPLYLAASKGGAEMVEKLLEAGADPNAALLSGETVLMTAIDLGHLPSVRSVLAHEAKVNVQESLGGQTPLMWASANKQPVTVGLLIERGADVHARSKGDFSPILFAAQQGDVDSARLLLAAGADLNDRVEKSGMTALLVAAAAGHRDLTTFLAQQGADPNAAEKKEGFTALHYAARRPSMLGSVEALLAQGANPNARLVKDPPRPTLGGCSLLGATPLWLAASRGNIDVVRALVAGGADPLLGTEEHTTSLMVAAGVGPPIVTERTPQQKQRALETTQFLVEQGADVNGVGEHGWTAMHGAAYQGMDSIIEFLVSQGARMDAKDKFGQTPLSIASGVITVGLGDYFYQSPRIFRQSTSDLLRKLGAPSLAASGVEWRAGTKIDYE